MVATLADIRNKVRRITARPSPSQISDPEIDTYINAFYVYDLPEHLKLDSLKVNYQFLTSANRAIYDFDQDLYLVNMPPVYIAGYQSYMTQSRENFYRVNSTFQFKQDSVAIGNGGPGPYTGTLTTTYIMQGYKPNPPGSYATGVIGNAVLPRDIIWGILFSGKGVAGSGGIAPSISLIDDGQGNLFDPADPNSNPLSARGTINYITGAFTINNFSANIANLEPINAQYVAYRPSRPQSVIYFNNQFMLYPVPDQAYMVSFEAFKYPTAFLSTAPTTTPLLKEWWQLLAYGAADKIFADNADFENMQKFRPLLDEQMRLVQRRTITQYSSERTATIYTEQTQFAQFPFGNMFGGI